MADSSAADNPIHTETNEEPDSKTKDWQRRSWLITYCPAGKYLTPDLLKQDGLMVDECHSTSDRAMNYTYVHLTKKVTQSRLENFMKRMDISERIVKKEIFGYDPIAGSSKEKGKASIESHIAFQMLLKHCRANEPSFKPNTDGEPVLKRGILFQALDIVRGRTVDLERQSKKQLISYAKTLEEKVEESKKQEAEIQSLASMYIQVCNERADLKIENAALKRKIEELDDK